MIAFDTDVLTEILLGEPAYVARAAAVPPDEQAVPVIVAEEILRGRLNVIRQAEAGKSKIGIERAYELLHETLADFRRINLLAYTSKAEALYRQWRSARLRLPTHDLRIAALCVAHAISRRFRI